MKTLKFEIKVSPERVRTNELAVEIVGKNVKCRIEEIPQALRNLMKK